MPGALFVMGDNRAHSADSTVHLCTKSATDCVAGDEYVSTDLVVGKVFVLLAQRPLQVRAPSGHLRGRARSLLGLT